VKWRNPVYLLSHMNRTGNILFLAGLAASAWAVAPSDPVELAELAEEIAAEEVVAEEVVAEPAPEPAEPTPEPPVAEPWVPPLNGRVAEELAAGGTLQVYRVPITDAISKPNLFILRRALKQAIDRGVHAIILDMDTPGGRLDVTLDMMELLTRFDGETITYVNKDAISAGAYIAMATDSIYFAPNGVMGAAAVVAATGAEIDESLKAKINSYLLARMRSYTERFPYRAEVIRAMADLDYELKIDDRVLKAPGELLSLTATEALERFGAPPRPLLADGIAGDLEDLLAQRYGEGRTELHTFAISWSEEAAKYLDSIAPILLGLGLLLLFIEFKTPGFGLFGILGLALVAIVFASNYMAGLAGFEAILFFLLGLALIVVDIFLFPGTFIFLILGILLILGSILWSLSDIWPAPDGDGPGGITFTVDAQALWQALYEMLGAFAVAAVGLVLIWRFLPKTTVYGRLVHATAGAMPDPVMAGGSQVPGAGELPAQGSTGVVTNTLHPLGEVEIGGRRYQATVAIGSLDKGTRVVVTGYRHFSLLVEAAGEDTP